VALAVFAFREFGRKPAPTPKQEEAVSPLSQVAEFRIAGKIQAHTTVAVPAPINGKLDFFHVDVGSEVSEGQPLAQIVSEALDAQQQAAKGDLDQAQSRLTNLEAAISAARLESSRARAEALRARSDLERLEKQYTRQKLLLEAGATPRLAAEKAEKEYRAAINDSKTLEEAAVNAETRVDGMMREADALRKTVAEKTEAYEEKKAELDAGEVRSPVDGVVVSRRGSLGDDVDRSLGDLFQIATDLSVLDVVVEPPAEILKRLAPGLEASVRVAELSGEGLPGVIRKIENGQVTIEFKNPLPEIKPGLTAEVTLTLKS
jgi:multidrug efflux pump subunit AcrA (membrane-fusion protein)